MLYCLRLLNYVCYVTLCCCFVLCCSSLFHKVSLWRSAKNPVYTEGALSAVENETEKSTWYQKRVEPYHSVEITTVRQRAYGRVSYLGLLRTGGLMLYLSPSCGAVGVFLAGAGLGVSISNPTTQKHVDCFIGNFLKSNIQCKLHHSSSGKVYLWSESLRGWVHEL